MEFFQRNKIIKIIILTTLCLLVIFYIKKNNRIDDFDGKKVYHVEKYKNLTDSVKYVGMSECISCHYDIYSTYIETGMGSSFGHATNTKSIMEADKKYFLYDSASNYYYHPYFNKDSLYLLEYQMFNDDTTFKRNEKINYIIGSGQHTNSHMCNFNNYLFQAPFTFYSQENILSLPPGYENGFNSRFNRKIDLECMSCHNAYPDVVLGSINKYNYVSSGIDCERCHGPGEIHVAEKKQGIIIDTAKEIDYSIVNPANLPSNLQFDICQRCHLQGNTILKDGKSFYDFKPGQKLSDFMSVFLPKYENNNDFLMASHVERLKMSNCFKNSELNCISCHNPHKSVKSESANFFESKCIGCHNNTKNNMLICKINKTSKCIDCHMPKSETVDIPHVTITDHYIRTNIDNKTNQSNKFLGLFSINEDDPDNLTLAKAYLNQFEKFQKSQIMLDSAKYYISKLNYPDKLRLEVHYYYLIKNFNQIINIVSSYDKNMILKDFNNQSFDNNDAYFWYRISDAFYNQEMLNEAKLYINKSIELSPYILDFQLRLGVIYMFQSDFEQAKKIFNNIIEEDKYFVDVYSTLASIYLDEKNYTMTEKIINEGLRINPNHTRLLFLQKRLFSGK